MVLSFPGEWCKEIMFYIIAAISENMLDFHTIQRIP